MERNIYVVSNDPVSPQKSVKIKVIVKDFHGQAGAEFQPQRIFKPGCISCHGDRGKGKNGEALYAAVCEGCHKAGGSAAALLDAVFLTAHPPAALRPGIAKGTNKMPGFSAAYGGPLSEPQIDSLISFLSSRTSSPPGHPR